MFLISEDFSETIERPTLVDVTELQLMGCTLKGVFDSSRSQYSKPVHTILWYNLPVWLPIEGLNEHAKTCRFNYCEHTENKDVLRNSSMERLYCLLVTDFLLLSQLFVIPCAFIIMLDTVDKLLCINTILSQKKTTL